MADEAKRKGIIIYSLSRPESKKLKRLTHKKRRDLDRKKSQEKEDFRD